MRQDHGAFAYMPGQRPRSFWQEFRESLVMWLIVFVIGALALGGFVYGINAAIAGVQSIIADTAATVDWACQNGADCK